MTRNRTLRTLIVVFAAGLSLLLAVGAFAAHPKAGETYSGFIPGNQWNGFKAPISFKVTKGGKRLYAFRWTGFGCFGAGGPKNVNPYLNNPYNLVKVGTIKVSSNGKFSVKNVKWTAHGSGPTQPTKVTYSTINGRFVTARKATGSIVFTQKMQGQICVSTSHGNPPLNFTVTTH
jgi:hypothetical protein